MSYFAHQAARLLVVTGISVKIGANAVFQTDGFADINDRPISIFHQVTTWFGWEGIENTFNVLGNIHRHDSNAKGMKME